MYTDMKNMDKLARYEHYPDPITAAVVVAAVGVGVGAAGTLQAGQAAAAQAKSAEAMAEFNAEIAEQEAKAIELRTGFEGRRQAEAAERRQSALRAALGASGVIPSAGAALRIQTEQAKESELEQLLIGFEGATMAARSRSQQVLDTAQAGIFSQRARAAISASRIQAGATLLQGFGQVGMAGRGKGPSITETVRGVQFTTK